MRRQLMKKMRKGSLTPSERTELKELDREVNRANRQAAGVGSAGLAAALAIASKTGALERGKDALGDFLDERAGIREERKGQKAIEKEEKREAKERAEDEADLSRRASAAARSEERADARAEREKQVELKELRKAQGEYEKMVEKEEKERKKDEEKLDKRLEKRGGFDPRTGEYVDSAKQRAADEEFDREFDESLPDAEVMESARLINEGRLEEAERLASQVMNPDESAMKRFRDRSAVQALRGGRFTRDRTLPIDLLPFDSTTSDYTGGFETTGNRREFSSEDLSRRDGPRVNNAKGGYTPFLRSMRDRIKRRFR